MKRKHRPSAKTLTGLLITVPLVLLLLAGALYPFQPHGGSLETPFTSALNRSNWQLTGPNVSFLQVPGSLLRDGNPSIQLGSIFNRSEIVSAQLNLNQAKDLSAEDYLIFSLYSSSDLLSTDQSFNALFNTPFRFSVTLISQDANKTYGPYSIRWNGWTDFALPLHYRGTLLTGDINQPVYSGINQTAAWTDSVSLAKIRALRIDFLGDSSFAGSSPHSLFLSELSVSRVNSTLLEGLNALIAATAILSVLLLTPVYVTRHLNQKLISPVLKHVRSFFSEFQFAKTRSRLFVGVVLTKIVIAVLTPLSSDFIDVIYGSLPVQPYVNPLTNSPAVGGYMDSLGYFMYRLWLLLPVDHVNLSQIFPGNYFVPTINEGIFHFPLTAGSVLLVLLLKTPNIIADLLIAILIYKIVLSIGKSQSAANFATAFWLLNPYDTLIIEMWANFEVLFVLPLILSVFFLVRGRPKSSAAALGSAVGVRLWSALLLPIFLSMVGRNREAYSTRRWSIITYMFIAVITMLVSTSPFIFFDVLTQPQNPRAPIRLDMPDIGFFFGIQLQLFDYFIILSVTLYVVYLFVLHDWWKPLREEAGAVFIVFFLLFFSLSKWLPHWLLWIMPFLAIYVGLSNSTRWYPRLFVLAGLGLAIVEQSWYFASWGNSFFFFPATTPTVSFLSNILFHFSGAKVIGIPVAYFLESAFVGICMAYVLRLYRDRQLKPWKLE